jgi:hypothetical protein
VNKSLLNLIGFAACHPEDREQGTGFPRDAPMPLAHALLAVLKDHGAHEIFGIPGDFVLPLFNGACRASATEIREQNGSNDWWLPLRPS